MNKILRLLQKQQLFKVQTSIAVTTTTTSKAQTKITLQQPTKNPLFQHQRQQKKTSLYFLPRL